MQTPAPFDYERATSVDHALALLERHGPEARLLAGGHSLLPMMKLRLARPEFLIDINDLADLSYIRVDGDHLAIGAMTRHADLLSSAVLGEHYAIFHDAERVIADPIVRNRGTIGGSLCQADPSEDLSAVASALRAEIVVRSASGSRTVPARVPHRPVRDGRRSRRDRGRDPGADPSRRGQRLREGRAAGRRLGGCGRRLLRRARRRHRRRRRHRAHRGGRPALLRPRGRGRAARPSRPTDENLAAAAALAAEHCEPADRPARPGGLQAPPRRRAHRGERCDEPWTEHEGQGA